jgi:Rieske Fe-S protein
MTQEPQQDRRATRRGVLLGVGLVGIGGSLTGCSTAFVPYDSNEQGQPPKDETDSSPSAAAGTSGGSMSTSGSSSGSQASGSTGTSAGGSAQGSDAAGSTGGGTATSGMTGTLLGLAADIPVGGGKVFMPHQVVVTQPAAGQFRAFSAVCTHVGCICNRVANGTIDCPCHGSTFKITNGAVVTGPAASPLPGKSIAIKDGKIMLL